MFKFVALRTGERMDGEWELDKEGAGRVKIEFGKGETIDGETGIRGRGRRGLEKRGGRRRDRSPGT